MVEEAMIAALKQRAQEEGLDIDFSGVKSTSEAVKLFQKEAMKQRAAEIVSEASDRPNSNTVETKNGIVITDYDSEGRVVSEMIQDKDGKPLQLQQTDARGNTSTSVFSYDEQGNHNATAHFKNGTVEYTYFKDEKPVETPDVPETLAIEKDVSVSMKKANQIKDEQMELKDQRTAEAFQSSLDNIEQRFMNEIHAERTAAEEIKQEAVFRQQGYSDKPVSYETVNKDGSRTVSSYDESGSTVSHYNKDNILIKESVQSRDGEHSQTTIYGNDGEVLMRHTKDGDKVTMTAQNETEDLTPGKETESSLEETTVLPAVRGREAEREAQTAVPVSAAASNKKINEDVGEYVEFEEIVEEPKVQTPQETKVEEVVAEEVQAPEMTTMPAPIKPRDQENVAEEVNTSLPAVRGGAENVAVKTAQTAEEKALALTDKEKALAKGFIEYASVQDKEKSDAYVKSMEVAVRDYMAQGLTPAQIQEKVSSVLAVAQSVAETQGLADPEALKALEKQATEGMAKLFSQVAPQKDGNETVLEAAPEKAPVKILGESEEEKAAKEKAAKEKAEAEAAKAKAEAEAEAAKVKAEKPAEEQVGTFGVAEPDSKDKDNKKGKGEKAPALETDLLKQVQNVAMLNRYYGFEAEKDSPPRPNPFQTITKAEKSPKGVKPPYAAAELASGVKMFNRPNSVDMVYKTEIMQDGSENSQLSFEDCMTMVRLGQQKGWTAAKLTGPKEFREQMYLACRALGMPVKDFQPSPELQKAGDEKEAQHEATRNHVKSLDARFPKMEAERNANKLSHDDVNYEFMDYLNDKGLGLPKAERKKYKGEKTAKKETEEKTGGEKEEKPKTKGRERKEKAEKVLETAVTEKIKAEAEAETVKGAPVKPEEKIVAEAKVETQKLLAAPKGPAEVLHEAGQKLIEAKETKVKTDVEQQRMLALPEKTGTKALPAVINKEIADRAVAKR